MANGASRSSETRTRPLPARVLPAIFIGTTETRCQARRVYFPTDSADLSDEARTDLTAYALCLKDGAAHEDLVVRGRTDPRGSEAYNESLSQRRAESVATFLQSQGVQTDRLDVRALGETGNVEGMPQLWPQQRRVTVAPVGSPPPIPAAVNGQPAP